MRGRNRESKCETKRMREKKLREMMSKKGRGRGGERNCKREEPRELE